MIHMLDVITGNDITINNLKVKNPTLKDINQFGWDNYFSLVQLFTFNPSDYMVELDDIGLDYTKIDTFTMFINFCQDRECLDNVSNDILSKLFWLTNIDDWKVGFDKIAESLLLYSPSTKNLITKQVFLEIREYLILMNFINNKDTIIPGNEITRKSMIEHERTLRKYDKKDNDIERSIANEISCLVWSNTSGYNYSNVMDLYIYQFNEGLSRINRIENYRLMMTGYYSGNISQDSFAKTIEKADWRTEFKYDSPNSKLETIGQIKNRTGM